MIDLARDGLISVVDIDRLNFPPTSKRTRSKI
jgi:hypothetical protein